MLRAISQLNNAKVTIHHDMNNIYAVITVVFALLYGFVLYITSIKLKELKGMVIVPSNWTGGTNIKELNELIDETTHPKSFLHRSPTEAERHLWLVCYLYQQKSNG
jgi:hypothetical protein